MLNIVLRRSWIWIHCCCLYVDYWGLILKSRLNSFVDKEVLSHFVLKTQLSCPSCIRQISRKCKSLVFTLLSNLDNYALVRLKAWNLNLIQRPFQQHHTTCLHSENMYYLAQKAPIWELLPWNLRNVGLIHERLKTIYDKTRGLKSAWFRMSQLLNFNILLVWQII